MARTPAHKRTPGRKIIPVLDALQAHYGRPAHRLWDPLETLVHGVLSQNTTDLNADRAFERLMATFRSWKGVASASQEEIEEAVRESGLAAQKAATIRRIMARLAERGRFSLDYLARMPLEEAEGELTAIKGVGVKTARLTLLFGFGLPTFVVDTHVLRVAQRLALVPARCTRERAHVLLDDLIPDGRKYGAHLNMIWHGRQLCHPRGPECDACPVRKWCAAGAAVRAPRAPRGRPSS